MHRRSVASLCTNVKLVPYSSARKPPNIQLLSPSAVAVRRRESAPLRTAVAPAMDCTADGSMIVGFGASSRFVLTVSQATMPAAPATTSVSATARTFFNGDIMSVVGGQKPRLRRSWNIVGAAKVWNSLGVSPPDVDV